ALELKQEMITRTPNDPRVFAALLELVPMAAKEKLAPRDVQEMAETLLKNAESYGPTFEKDFGVRLVEALEAGYPTVAVETGARIAKSLDPKTAGEARLQVLTAVASSLRKMGRAEDADKLAAQVDAAEEATFKEYEAKELDFKPAPTSAKAARPVIVELF